MELNKMTLKEIEKYFKKVKVEESIKYIELLRKDKRKSVVKLADKIEKNYYSLIKERERILNLWKIENEIFNLGYNFIAGIDEAGRGPLAGPVVAAAVILPKNQFIYGIDDSKKISEEKREKLYEHIKQIALDIGIGIVDNNTIDKINILNATKLAMKKAIDSLNKKPEFLLIDAVNLSDISIKQKNIIKGDSKSISIAAASIIAKVTRDNIVRDYAKIYPKYGFDSHKGYGTKQHYESIKRFGITPFHRKTFLKSL